MKGKQGMCGGNISQTNALPFITNTDIIKGTGKTCDLPGSFYVTVHRPLYPEAFSCRKHENPEAASAIWCRMLHICASRNVLLDTECTVTLLCLYRDWLQMIPFYRKAPHIRPAVSSIFCISIGLSGHPCTLRRNHCLYLPRKFPPRRNSAW